MEVPVTPEMLLAYIDRLTVRLAHEEIRSAALDAKVEEQAKVIEELSRALSLMADKASASAPDSVGLPSDPGAAG